MERMIFFNAQVVTMDEKCPKAQAILIEDGKITKVGATKEILALKDENTQVRDLQQKTLMPAFIDSHSHLSAVAYNLLMVNASPSPTGSCDTREALLAQFQKAYEEGDFSDGSWLMGMGYDNAAWEDGKHITRLDLDKISTKVPISCMHVSGHCSVLNTKALQLLGYWGDFEAPEGGTVERFPDTNEPNGLITERALLAPHVQSKIKAPSFEKVLEAIRKACTLYASYGMATAQDAKVGLNEYRLLTEAGKRGFLNMDVVGMVSPEAADQCLVKGQKVGAYKNHVRMGGYKIYLDGSPQAKTAWLSRPYHIPPEGKEKTYAGFRVMQDKDCIEAAKTCLENDWQLNVHCNGDAACEQLITCYEKAIEETGRQKDIRPVMVHAQTLRDDQLDRMKTIGMMPTYFLDHVYYWGDWHYEAVLGPERAERISPAGSTVSRGIPFTMHQDAPVVKPNPLFAVHNAVNRITRKGRLLGADQRISVEEALKGVTVYAAYQIFEEDKKGSITEGKRADLVILGENPLTADKEKIKDIPVLETIKDGITIYRRGEDTRPPDTRHLLKR